MQFAPVFQDHAVLQRNQSIPVWGYGSPGETVTVSLAGNASQVKIGPDGNWSVRLPALPAGGPHELTAESPSGRVSVRDILVGEVWVCSGQSNMQWALEQTGEQNIGENLPQVRLLTVGTPARLGRQTEIDHKWELCTPASLAAFSAVGGWFGRKIHKELGVPVGLINNAWGGTRVQAWISRDGMMLDPTGRDEVRHYESYVFAADRMGAGEYLSFTDWEQRGAPKDTGNAGLKKGWATTEFSDSSWKTMSLPGAWQNSGHPGSGVFWFRRTLNVPAGWAGKELSLNIGAVDKHDDTYVNGERVGGLSWEAGPNSWCTPRSYNVPGKLVKAGKLTVAVRARSHVYHGGLIGPASKMRIFPVGNEAAAISLAGDWRYEIEQDWGVQTPPGMVWGDGNPNSPYILFDSRLSPLIPYGIRGAIWYQGESNAGEPEIYKRMLPLMIQDWRRAWGQGDFPFIQVQLANYMSPKASPAPSNWALLRDSQLSTTRAVPNCGMAVAIDIGDEKDIHPRDKKSVGERLAFWALRETYGKTIAPSGPVFEDMVIEGKGRCRCRFQHATGLKTKNGGPVARVEIAGVDRVFRWAQAEIEGDTLVAWHPEILRPMAVRYAWADNPEGCNLVNGEGLPASPFRTDAF